MHPLKLVDVGITWKWWRLLCCQCCSILTTLSSNNTQLFIFYHCNCLNTYTRIKCCKFNLFRIKNTIKQRLWSYSPICVGTGRKRKKLCIHCKLKKFLALYTILQVATDTTGTLRTLKSCKQLLPYVQFLFSVFLVLPFWLYRQRLCEVMVKLLCSIRAGGFDFSESLIGFWQQFNLYIHLSSISKNLQSNKKYQEAQIKSILKAVNHPANSGGLQ